jgi:ATP-binding cassette subfamily B protein
MFKPFPFYRQLDQMDCGPSCLRMVASYYGREYTLQYLRERTFIDRRGVNLLGISEAAEQIGMDTRAVKMAFEGEGDRPGLLDAPLPAIAYWNQQHFLVVYKANKKNVWVADPGEGKFKLKRTAFEKSWLGGGGRKGILLLLEPTPDFYTQEGEKVNKASFSFLFRYLKPYRSLLVQLVLGMLLGSLFQLIFPFLTQALVDVGIQNQNIGFVYLILVGQLMLFFSQTSVGLLESWILLHIGTRVSVALINDFLIKLMKLPIGFFDAKQVGDLMQRIGDHHRIESVLTTTTLSTLFSFLNLIVFSIVLLLYNVTIFFIFLFSSILHILWIVIFLKKRKEVDYAAFQQMSENQSNLIETIQGMQEIKLQNSERKRRWAWANIQAKLFKVSIKTMAISQYQDAGAGFITQLKNILISFVAAKAVIEGQMTLGMMMAAQYIVGQLNGPLQQMVGFIRNLQDAKISLERLGEIHNKESEEDGQMRVDILPENGDIVFDNVSFRYNPLSDDVLKDINLVIPKGKVTAIVGTSGSGKTTLVKLILRFYQPTKGHIKIGGIHLDTILNRAWREKCGAVMQDGFVFSDSIANNIAESDDSVDRTKLLQAVKTANIQSFIESLPLGYNTVIGSRGNGISQGQRQRLLIARAVYKNPDYLFFDEATNALDAKNERTIMENMDRFFEGRTVVVVAHRLSTVKNADQIVVLEQGEIVEIGTHQQLTEQKGTYYELVKNQLELGS